MNAQEQILTYTYLAYAFIAVGLVVWLARTLYRSGALFLYDVFPENRPLAEAVNKLLVTGFFMFNLGFAFFLLKSNAVQDTTEGIEVLARKLGTLLIVLALLHLTNMFILNNIRRRHSEPVQPPVPPNRVLVTAGGYTGTPDEQWAEYERRLNDYQARLAPPRTEPPTADEE